MDEKINTPNNSEIDQALKEFEAKASTEQTQKASETFKNYDIPKEKEVEGVKFETENYKAVKFYSETTTPKMIKLVMKWSGGAVKEERHAEYVLLGFVIVAIGISLYLFFGGVHFQQEISPAAMEEINQMP